MRAQAAIASQDGPAREVERSPEAQQNPARRAEQQRIAAGGRQGHPVARADGRPQTGCQGAQGDHQHPAPTTGFRQVQCALQGDQQQCRIAGHQQVCGQKGNLGWPLPQSRRVQRPAQGHGGGPDREQMEVAGFGLGPMHQPHEHRDQHIAAHREQQQCGDVRESHASSGVGASRDYACRLCAAKTKHRMAMTGSSRVPDDATRTTNAPQGGAGKPCLRRVDKPQRIHQNLASGAGRGGSWRAGATSDGFALCLRQGVTRGCRVDKRSASTSTSDRRARLSAAAALTTRRALAAAAQ
jgi:hypothetical protein